VINVTSIDANLQNITIYLYNSTNNLINTTNTLTTPNFVNYTNLADGIYYFNATAFDKAGNFNATETRNVSIDAIKPAVSFASNTETSGTSVSRNNIVINATATDANLRNITIYLYNSTARINLTKQLRKPVIFQLHWPG
jgi:hypothetical protein